MQSSEVLVIVERSTEHGLKFRPFDFGASTLWLDRRRRKLSARLGLNPREDALVERIRRLKRESGSHSPSAWTLAKLIPELRLKVDACFLSNPYATKLFLMHFHREVIRPRKLRSLLELYPSQNRVIAGKLGYVLDIEPESIFVGNGAAEIIQAILHRFTGDSIVVNLPTFSPYYEFARSDTRVIFNTLHKEDEFRFDPEAYLKLVRRERPDTVVLINPNNPDGGYVPHAAMVKLIEALHSVPTVIVDESFLHFACEDSSFNYRSVADRVARQPNLIVVKSMSKDFGIAGIRAGYAVMAPERVRTLLDNGFLWNSSGLAEYFFDLYCRADFQTHYERERIRFIRNTRRFLGELATIDALKIYPSHANFALAEIKNGSTAEDLVYRLLIRRGIYTRACDDKKGLEPGKFVRIAARSRAENGYMIRSLRRILD